MGSADSSELNNFQPDLLSFTLQVGLFRIRLHETQIMRLLVSEFLCSGGWPLESLPTSLRQEGQAMLLALLQDALKIPNLQPVTLWDNNAPPFPLPGVECHLVNAPHEELEILGELAAQADATLLIAPEFDDILTHRALLVEGVGGRLCGPNSSAIVHCADKLNTFEILREAGVPCIETQIYSIDNTDLDTVSFPAVVKPRDGAGSQETYLLHERSEIERHRPRWEKSSLLRKAIWQPYLSGQATSLAVLITPESYLYEPLPPCRQLISEDDRLRYTGGIIPATIPGSHRLAEIAVKACQCFPGLRGYVGVDLLIPDDDPNHPVVIEINPRITTSYLGYTALCKQNLLARWLGIGNRNAPLTWHPATLKFDAQGGGTTEG